MQTQSALANHADKVKSLEGVIAEHEHVKHELQAMRDLMEQRKVEMDTIISHSRLQVNGDHQKEDEDSDHDNDDDTRSVLTIVPDEAESSRAATSGRDFAQEQRDRFEEDEDRARNEGLRPRTPEPHGMGMNDDDDESDSQHMRRPFDASALMDTGSNFTEYPMPSELSSTSSSATDADGDTSDRSSTAELHSQNVILTTRLETVSQQLDSAVSLSRQLHSQSEAAQRSIELLEAKVQSLETLMEQTKAEQSQRQQEQTAAEAERREGASKQHVVLNEAWETWRQRVEGQWRTERQEWDQERLRLQNALREWEGRMADLEHRDQRRSMESSDLIAALQREREESALAWKRREETLQRFLDSQISDEERDARPASRLVNGTKGTKGRRITSSSPSSKPAKSKKRRASANAVATPPHSPPMNGAAITERSSEASGSRSVSPDISARSSMVDAFANGHIKPELLPLSPAPSVRTGTRTGSIASEPDSADDTHPAPSIGHLAPPSPNPTTKAGGARRRLRENVSSRIPSPYYRPHDRGY